MSSTIIEDLYEGTLDRVAWDRAILSIVDSVRASGAMLFAFNPSTGGVLRDEQHRVDPKVVADYANYWTFEDHRRKYALTLPVGEPGTEVSLRIPLKDSRIYNELLLPVDMPHFMPAWLHKSPQKAVALSLQGSLKRGPFESRDIERVRVVLPHLARALEIRDRLEAAEVRATNLSSVLDVTTFGVIVLDADQKIIEANAVASALMQKECGLNLGPDGVLETGRGESHHLASWLLGGAAPNRIADTLLHIPREGKLPLSVLATPISKVRTAWIAGEPAWLLLLFDPERRVTFNTQILVKDLGLSRREAQVASLLAAGLNVAEISRRLHITVHTVRAQLKSAFQKTGCRSQTDLTRRILLGPGLIPLT
jgi:DNA-binding CsgD family transcriptional regulator